MDRGPQTFLSTRLFDRVRKWEKDEQIYLSALKDSFSEFEILEVLAGFQCAIEQIALDGAGRVESVKFWLKSRGAFIALTLRVVQPDVFVLDVA